MSTIQQHLTRGIQSPEFPYITIDKENDVEISIGIKNKVLYISFLGSVSFKDWLHNFMIWKKPYKQMKNIFFVHSGFLKIYKILQSTIESWLLKNNEYESIIINGHSLGGAIATLCYEDVMFRIENNILQLSKDVVECITSGSPKVFSWIGNKILQTRCKNLIRVVYKNDGIAKNPSILLGYKHIGNFIHYGKSSMLDFLNPSYIYDHDTTNYLDVENIQKVSNETNNYVYSNVVKVYKIIYIILGILSLCNIGCFIYNMFQ